MFNVGDEFIVHAFRAYLIASICCHLKLKSPDDEINHDINHDITQQWLENTAAAAIVAKALYPEPSKDPVYHFHKSFVNMAFLYSDLRMAIHWEDGPHIIRHGKLWIHGNWHEKLCLRGRKSHCKSQSRFPSSHCMYRI